MPEESPVIFERIKRRWRALFRKDEVERELDDELRFHLERDAAQNLLSGMDSEEARYAALRSFGGVEQAKEECRDARGVRILEESLQDLRYSTRMLLKHRGFTLIAILTLALGIGANTAIFSVINATLLRPLPYKNPDQIVMVWGTNPGGFGWRGKTGFSAPSFLDYQQQNQVFERMATFNGVDFTLRGEDNSERIHSGMVTAEFFGLLAVQPILGRTFVAEDGQPGRDHVVVLSYGLWQRRFGSNQRIIGQTIRLDATSYIVIGVLPQGFDFSIPDYFESRGLWVPALLPQENSNSERGHKYLSVIARLKPAVTLSQAEQDMRVITERLAREYPSSMSKFGVKLIPLSEQVVGDIRLTLLLLFGAVGFVLLIACANVANLQLARASTRQREIAIRRALGASRVRLLRQLLTESVLLSLIGGTLGLLLALWGITLLTRLSPAGILHGTIATVDLTVLAYALVLSLVTSILFGLAPALQLTSTRYRAALKEGGRNSAASEGGLRLRKLLTVSEVALSMMLLIGAGLLIRSFIGLLRVNPGFESKNILTARVYLPQYSYPEVTRQTAFYMQAMERIKGLPGVIAIGATDELPLTMGTHTSTFFIDGRANIDDLDQSLAVQNRLVSSDYFRVMGIPIISGRAFADTDDGSAIPVALVNQSFARRFFPNENAIGQHLRFKSENPWITIVGIVGDVRGFGLDKEAKGEIYLPDQQQSFATYNRLSRMHLVVRTTGDPNAIAGALLESIREIDKGLPVLQPQTMETVLAASIAERRSNMVLLGLFALVALMLTGVGIHGVISYSVTQRTQEIGIRMALGAQARDVLQLVIRQGMSLVLIGLCIGLVGAIALTRVIVTLLFGVSAKDPLTFVAVAALLSIVSFVACYIPARRATRVDPLIALRCE
jgi:putative ABC transport system permease protein